MSSAVWVMITVPTNKEPLESSTTTDQSKTIKSISIGTVTKSNEGNHLALPVDDKKKDQIELPIQTILEKTLKELEINNAAWIKSTDDKLFHVYFACDVDESDSIIYHIQMQGIGSLPQTFIGIIPFALAYQAEEDADVFLDETNDLKPDESVKNDLTKKQSGFKTMQETFLKSVTARLTVAQVVASVQSGAEMTFDFVCYVLCAAWLAALGLMESDVVTLVASMLVSPLMGPVMAMTFGLIVRDEKLRNIGIRNAIIGFGSAILFGFFYGCLLLNFTNEYNSSTTWPTAAMRSRGQLRSLWVGGLIALPSGAAVAVSMLSGNQASLVGVAISASLLPPCVNSGLLWSFSFLRAIRALNEDYISTDNNATLTKPSLVLDPNYEVSYSTNFSYECFWLGLVSLGLATVNVICILLMSWLLLKIKEVSPVDEKSSATSRFWKEDIKIAREYNKTVRERKRSLHQDLLVEWAEMNGLDPQELLSENPEARVAQLATFKDMVKDVEEDEVFQQIVMHKRPKSDWRKMSIAAVESFKLDGTRNKSSSSVSIEMDHRELRGPRRSIALPSPSPRSILANQTSDQSPRNSSSGAKNYSISTISGLNQHADISDFQQRRRQSSAQLRKSLRISDHSPHSVWPRRNSDVHKLMPTNPVASEFARRSRKMRSTGESSEHD